jgi:Cu(I)/Ag(I) efflux system membrane fusion protein
MHPSVESAEPGQCPLCGMDLTPVSREDPAAGTVTLDARRRQLIGLKTAPVSRGDLHETLRLVGTVQYDPAALTDVALPLEGKIAELFVVYEGTPVRRGDPLFSVSAPALQEAEAELVRVLEDTGDPGGRAAQAARARLRSLGLGEAELAELEATLRPAARRSVRSPVDGILVQNRVRTGSVFWLGETLMQIVDPARLWIKAAAYESDVNHVRAGMAARVQVPFVSPDTLEGSVSYIRPVLDHHDRTADVFVGAPYSGPPVLANSYADVFLDLVLRDQLLVPEQAVIYAGDSRLVFVDTGAGRLEPRKIRTGRRTRDQVQVLDGLAEGEAVVISGNFLLASESKLKSGIDQW